MSTELLNQIAICVERGKVNQSAPFPPDMKGQDGADELTKKAIEDGIRADKILANGLVPGMESIGIKFRENRVFVPEVLMAAKAMTAGMNHLRPFFQSGEVKRKGTFIIGTVMGDLHDIGKNLLGMMVEGGGWEVIDLGIDVQSGKFIEALDEHPHAYVGLSCLLTTTMLNMEKIVLEISAQKPDTKILIGGAPVTEEFKNKIGAHWYSPDPQGAVEYLNAQQ
ncbi:MAG: cobalamin-binding protein [Bacteroidetes bacterium]|jgi:methanogenic corrinoid protein MtbC1|nr:cobalamin-binding protein [Bacteroidota bacterium]MBT3748732.1 cobalamin-binding protein [Bacteroidota bacterium]MBT4399252.1 cobalamin-binding protein [Bacteroidota bacterium]MBT4409964.1 cobalamin-binding protein [Bacteroidota bacterium]MBT5427939.1 cobalamin-binding protein [Bacteroidota bacterium]